MTTTDWRGLCEELVNELHGYASANPHHDSDALVARARAALAAEPVGEGPTGDAAVEAAAELIYNQAMKWAATQPIPSDHINIPAWQQGGNSDAQEVARRTARAALAAKPLVKGPTDEELLELARAELNNSPNWEEPEYDASNPFPYEAPGVAWLNFARAAIARFGHQSAAAAEGEGLPSDGGYESGTMWTGHPCRPAAQKVLAAAEGEAGGEVMINEHPITPLPELVEEWIAEIWHEGTPVRVSASDIHVATQAARWGADQQLEVCVNYVDNNMSGNKARRLRAICRPKPPGLKGQTKAKLNRLTALVSTNGALSMAEPIRCALEQLDALP